MLDKKNEQEQEKKTDGNTTQQDDVSLLEELQKKCDEYLAGWKRAKADYSNLKKEQDKRNKEVVEYAHAHVMSEVIPVYDNFKAAATHKPENEDKQWQNWAAGIDHIQKQLQEVLKKFNIEEIKTVGENFDPLLHESMGEEEVEGQESGKIIKEVKSGYILNGKVVAPAKVIIAK